MPKAPAPCGTDAAYQRHRLRKEEIDADCREAHRLAKNRQKAAKLANPGPSRHCPCGTRLLIAEHDLCSRCRRKACNAALLAEKEHDTDRSSPDRWVRRGLIWHPVYDERSEVA